MRSTLLIALLLIPTIGLAEKACYSPSDCTGAERCTSLTDGIVPGRCVAPGKVMEKVIPKPVIIPPPKKPIPKPVVPTPPMKPVSSSAASQSSSSVSSSQASVSSSMSSSLSSSEPLSPGAMSKMFTGLMDSMKSMMDSMNSMLNSFKCFLGGCK